VPLKGKRHAGTRDKKLADALKKNSTSGACGNGAGGSWLIDEGRYAGESKVEQQQQQAPGGSVPPNASGPFINAFHFADTARCGGRSKCSGSCPYAEHQWI
jgi:hypothetical protein